MKNLVGLIIISISVLPVGSYGMSGDALAKFNWLNFLRLGRQPTRDRDTGNRIVPLSPLAANPEQHMGRPDFQTPPLTISLADVTPEKLKDARRTSPGLRSLTIRGSGITGADIALLAEAFPDVESLTMNSIGITQRSAQILSQLAVFRSLRELNVSGNYMGDAVIEVLAQAPFARQLESLNLSSTGITAEGMQILSQPGVFMSLRELDLSGSPYIGDAGIRALAQAPFARQLESLNLRSTNITLEGMQILSGSNVFMSLRQLNLENNYSIRDAGVEALAQAPFARQLESLNVSGTEITTEAVRTLSQPGIFMSIRELNLSNNIGIKGAALEFLLKAPFARKLELLNLKSTGIVPAAVDKLVESGAFKESLEITS